MDTVCELQSWVTLVTSQRGFDQVSGPWKRGFPEAQVSTLRLLCSMKAPAACSLACLDHNITFSLVLKVTMLVVLMTASQTLALCQAPWLASLYFPVTVSLWGRYNDPHLTKEGSCIHCLLEEAGFGVRFMWIQSWIQWLVIEYVLCSWRCAGLCG